MIYLSKLDIITIFLIEYTARQILKDAGLR